MLGVIINCITVIIGSMIGMTFKNLIPKKVTDGIMTGIGLCTVYIGVDGALKGENTLVLILSMALGATIGFVVDLDGKINAFADFATKPFKKDDGLKTAEGFVTACLIFCVGAMTLVGSLQAGVNGDNTTLITKAFLDLISSLALASTFGIGVLLSTVFVLVFQGGLVLISSFAGDFLTLSMQNEMICVGSVIIIGLGLNIIGVSKIKVAKSSAYSVPKALDGNMLLSSRPPRINITVSIPIFCILSKSFFHCFLDQLDDGISYVTSSIKVPVMGPVFFILNSPVEIIINIYFFTMILSYFIKFVYNIFLLKI